MLIANKKHLDKSSIQGKILLVIVSTIVRHTYPLEFGYISDPDTDFTNLSTDLDLTDNEESSSVFSSVASRDVHSRNNFFLIC